jgi:hypothetical protein
MILGCIITLSVSISLTNGKTLEQNVIRHGIGDGNTCVAKIEHHKEYDYFIMTNKKNNIEVQLLNIINNKTNELILFSQLPGIFITPNELQYSFKSIGFVNKVDDIAIKVFNQTKNYKIWNAIKIK